LNNLQKRCGNLTEEESIIGFDALYESAEKCKRSVVWKSPVTHYCLNKVEETLKLEMELKDGTYKARPSHRFKITHPKERECLSIAFRDRVYQRSMNDNVIYPQMSRSFIHDNAACQQGKGTDFARDRLVCFLQKMYRKHNRKFYVQQLDIKGYYPNMSHEIAKNTFKSVLSESTYKRSEAVLSDQYAGEVGYNPGSQMIQIAGIAVLNKLDHYIKEELRIKYYIRYMDDMILLHEDKQVLRECRKKIEAKLKEMNFELHEKKSKLFPIKQGLRFLGFRYVVTKTGKVLQLIDKKNVQNEKRKLVRVVTAVKQGRITKAKADEMYRCWREHLTNERGFRKDKDWKRNKRRRRRHGKTKHNNHKVLEHMDEFYKSLWNNEGVGEK